MFRIRIKLIKTFLILYVIKKVLQNYFGAKLIKTMKTGILPCIQYSFLLSLYRCNLFDQNLLDCIFVLQESKMIKKEL